MEAREFLARMYVLLHNEALMGPLVPKPWFPSQYVHGDPWDRRSPEQIKAARGMFYKRTRANYRLLFDEENIPVGLLHGVWEERYTASDAKDGTRSFLF